MIELYELQLNCGHKIQTGVLNYDESVGLAYCPFEGCKIGVYLTRKVFAEAEA